MPPNHPSNLRRVPPPPVPPKQPKQPKLILRPETYDEALTLTPLPDGKLHSAFDFNFSAPWYDQPHPVAPNAFATHHSVAPPVLSTLLHRFRVSSFHLTLSSGRWAPTWPLAPTSQGTPASGIELVAWLELLDGEDPAAEAARWADFTAALGGLFCAGIGSASTPGGEGSHPTWAYTFDAPGDPAEHALYHALLPKLSATCTESLTPFVALLPCTSKAGLASLLNPHTLFDGDWTLLAVHAVRRPDATAHFRLQVGSVVDPVRQHRLKNALGKRDFSFQSLYARELARVCPVARASEVRLVVPGDSVNPFTIEPSDRLTRREVDGQLLAIWNTTSLTDGPLDVQLKWPGEMQFRYPHPSTLPVTPITVRRLLTGYGQERGRIGVEIVNHQDVSAEVVWVETWPWWVRGFIHTLDATTTAPSSNTSGKALSFTLLWYHAKKTLDALTEKLNPKLSYTPPIARRRPTTLQARLHLPPHSTARLLVSYEASYLWYTEYPPDAHRGFEVPGALVVLLDSRTEKPRLRLHTPSTLLSLPTPDFSMPYNVIILTSTVIALFFGRVMNSLVREWVVVDLSKAREGEGAAAAVGNEKNGTVNGVDKVVEAE